jgi:hypothetical protein
MMYFLTRAEKYKYCFLYRFPDHRNFNAQDACACRDVPRQLPCSGYRQSGHSECGCSLEGILVLEQLEVIAVDYA